MRKEEKEMTQMKECTFKPKINSNFNQVDVTKSSDVKDRTKRIEVLYKKGQSNVYNKKDKTTDEYEVEKYHKECTFKPNLEKLISVITLEIKLSQCQATTLIIIRN